jgi:hypothetical protein
MKWNMGNRRLWLYRSLVIATAGLMIASAVLTWWSCSIDVPAVSTKTAHVYIYEYGLRHDLVELKEYVAADETPTYQSVLAWAYIGLSVGLMLWSTWFKGKKGRLLLGGIGLTYIVYAAIAIFVVVANRISDFDISLFGRSSTIYTTTVDIRVSFFTTLHPGYYLAYGAGLACIVLSLLRNRIVGNR